MARGLAPGVEIGAAVGVADARAVGADEGAAVGLVLDELSDAQPLNVTKNNTQIRINITGLFFKDMPL